MTGELFRFGWRRPRIRLPLCFAVGLVSFSTLALGLAGCQANPFSLSVDVVTSRWAKQELAQWEPRLVGLGLDEVDKILGARNDTLEPLDGGSRWIIYPSPRNPTGESFLVLDVTPDNRIGRVGVWKRNRDGVLDIWRGKRLLNDCFTLTQEESEAESSLGPALREFVSVNTHYRAVFYEQSDLVPGGGAKYVILCFDDDDLCADVRLVGVLAAGGVAEGAPAVRDPDSPVTSREP